MGKATLFLNGEILTANARDELCDAILIEDGRIVYVGESSDALSLVDEDAEIIDLEKRAVIPGFINTYPTDFTEDVDTLSEMEARASKLLSLGWTSLRFTQRGLSRLRHFVADGSLTETAFPYLFALYERAELFCERSRMILLSREDIECDSAQRRAEWAVSDKRPIALEAEGKGELRAALTFLSAFSQRHAASPRNRLYLFSALQGRPFPRYLFCRVLPVFLSVDPTSSEALLDLLEYGLPAALASKDPLVAPLRLFSELLSPCGDDFRSVPPLLKTLSLYAASLESLGDSVGSLEWGKLADFSILSGALIGCPPSCLDGLHVTECRIGGRRLSAQPIETPSFL